MKNGQEWIRLSTKLIHCKAFGLDNFVHVNQFISENPKKGREWNRDDILWNILLMKIEKWMSYTPLFSLLPSQILIKNPFCE